jgi:hypothetical protein
MEEHPNLHAFDSFSSIINVFETYAAFLLRRHHFGTSSTVMSFVCGSVF